MKFKLKKDVYPYEAGKELNRVASNNWIVGSLLRSEIGNYLEWLYNFHQEKFFQPIPYKAGNCFPNHEFAKEGLSAKEKAEQARDKIRQCLKDFWEGEK